MNKAEDIAGYKEIIDGLTDFDEAYKEKHAKELLNLVLQAHTNEVLDELKDPSKIREIMMGEEFEHLKIKDDLGWTGEWRMSNKSVLDVLITLIEEM